jgi:hypothetical protein
MIGRIAHKLSEAAAAAEGEGEGEEEEEVLRATGVTGLGYSSFESSRPKWN